MLARQLWTAMQHLNLAGSAQTPKVTQVVAAGLCKIRGLVHLDLSGAALPLVRASDRGADRHTAGKSAAPGADELAAALPALTALTALHLADTAMAVCAAAPLGLALSLTPRSQPRHCRAVGPRSTRSPRAPPPRAHKYYAPSADRRAQRRGRRRRSRRRTDPAPAARRALTRALALPPAASVALGVLAQLPALRALELAECVAPVDRDMDAARALCDILPALHALALAGTLVGDVGARALARAAPTLTRLHSLDLSECGVSVVSAAALAAVLVQLPHFTHLQLSRQELQVLDLLPSGSL
jgi:hypothetical protein